MPDAEDRFAVWLERMMRMRGLTQAALARSMGIGETQISRWRRGRAVPTVYSLQRLAEVFAVPRATLDALAGYPTGEPKEHLSPEASRPENEGELRAYQALLGQLMEEQVPRDLWPIYLESCRALAQALRDSYQSTLARAKQEFSAAGEKGTMGFQTSKSEPTGNNTSI